MHKKFDGICLKIREKAFNCGSHFMVYISKALLLTFFSALILSPHEISAFWPFESATKEDCIAQYLQAARTPAAKEIVKNVCKCKFDSNCKYPKPQAIDCILSNIGEAQDNKDTYLMMNACLQSSLITAQ